MNENNTITLQVGGYTLRFTPTEALYNKLINEMSMDNKVAPAKNYLMRCIHDDDKPALKTLIDLPGVALGMVSALNEEFLPDLDITVKK
ncbi:putative phage tail assembly chaperone [Edwardsiella tarda]|uniref:putative phage tail assembly chaperone n=1 Tax=Edwardsiella tarda TaxID=636 RepID=UPI002444D850|nr:putative phage tail assembly chaperone [Edwardsiella tarda]WGE29416.1 putative phage tail assembly chaperone [Edwardsiella tarda]